MLVHASSFSSTNLFMCLSCLLVFMVVWTFCSGGVSGFDPVYVFCCNVRSSCLFVSVTTCLLFMLLGPDHSGCASSNALTDTAHTSPLGWNVVLQHLPMYSQSTEGPWNEDTVNIPHFRPLESLGTIQLVN